MILSFSRMITRKQRWPTPAPKVLNNFLGLSFGATETPRQSLDSHRTRLPVSVPPSPPSAGIVHFSLKKFVAQLLSADSREVRTQPNDLHNHLSIHAERCGALESLLKTERERTRQLTQELLTARSALKQMDELQSDLEVERETGRLLVQFLEDAEREAQKVPVLEQLLRQRDDVGNTVGSTWPANNRSHKDKRRPDAS
jgi:hypothetical protein